MDPCPLAVQNAVISAKKLWKLKVHRWKSHGKIPSVSLKVSVVFTFACKPVSLLSVLYFGCMLLSTAVIRLEFTICPFVLLFFNLHSSMRLHQYFMFSSPTPTYFPSLKMCSFRFFFFVCVCDFNNVLFTFLWIEPTIACWPILTPFEHHLQSVTVLDNERDLPIVWSFQAIFSIELNGFQMEELAGRKETKWSVVSEWLC